MFVKYFQGYLVLREQLSKILPHLGQGKNFSLPELKINTNNKVNPQQPGIKMPNHALNMNLLTLNKFPKYAK